MMFRFLTRQKIEKRNQGSGLVEVLVALAILSMTMITVVSVTTTSLRRIKRDEVKDRAVGIQLRALEFAKSPASDIGVSGLINTDIGYYVLDVSGGEIELQKENGSEILSVQNCNDSSDYYIDLSNFGYESTGDNLICNQVIVEFLDERDGVQTYQVTSLLVYNIEGKLVFSELIGFRREK